MDLTVEQLATELGVCEESIRRGIRSGQVRGAVRIGSGYRVPSTELERIRKEGIVFSPAVAVPTGAEDPNNTAEDAN